MSRSRFDAPRVTRFYHASPRRLRHGDVLTGGRPGGYARAAAKMYGGEHVPSSAVCMTDSPAVHGTIADPALAADWFVYEVEPLQPVEYIGANNEFRTRSARVLRLVGRVGGLSTKFRPGTYYNEDRERFLSFPPPRPRRGVKTRVRH